MDLGRHQKKVRAQLCRRRPIKIRLLHITVAQRTDQRLRLLRASRKHAVFYPGPLLPRKVAGNTVQIKGIPLKLQKRHYRRRRKRNLVFPEILSVRKIIGRPVLAAGSRQALLPGRFLIDLYAARLGDRLAAVDRKGDPVRKPLQIQLRIAVILHILIRKVQLSPVPQDIPRLRAGIEISDRTVVARMPKRLPALDMLPQRLRRKILLQNFPRNRRKKLVRFSPMRQITARVFHRRIPPARQQLQLHPQPFEKRRRKHVPIRIRHLHGPLQPVVADAYLKNSPNRPFRADKRPRKHFLRQGDLQIVVLVHARLPDFGVKNRLLLLVPLHIAGQGKILAAILFDIKRLPLLTGQFNLYFAPGRNPFHIQAASIALRPALYKPYLAPGARDLAHLVFAADIYHAGRNPAPAALVHRPVEHRLVKYLLPQIIAPAQELMDRVVHDRAFIAAVLLIDRKIRIGFIKAENPAGLPGKLFADILRKIIHHTDVRGRSVHNQRIHARIYRIPSQLQQMRQLLVHHVRDAKRIAAVNLPRGA